MDNDSSDDTAAVAAAWGARVVPEARVGIPAAAATGYDSARGDVIARLDADSRPDERWVERIVTTMSADPDLDAVTGSGQFFDLPVVLRAARLERCTWARTTSSRTSRSATPRCGGRRWRCAGRSWLAVRSQRDAATTPSCTTTSTSRSPSDPGGGSGSTGALRVGVSARSLRGHAQRVRRFDRAWRTLRLNWRVAPPWDRWRARLAQPPVSARR